MNNFNPIDRINELCTERGWSYYQLAKASGITYSTLSTMINKQNMPTLPTLLKLCQGFGISMAGFFEPEQSLNGLTSDQKTCLMLFSRLSEQDRQLALAYMKGLHKQL